MVTVSNSYYNGDVLDVIYQVFDTANEVAALGLAHVMTGIKKQRALPKIYSTDDPFDDYSADAPVSDSITTTYAERFVEPKPMMMYETFLPEDWNDVWEELQPDGDFTNATQNPQVIAAMLAQYQNKMGSQVARLFYQGDTSLAAGQALNKFDGIITRAKADVNVPKTTPAGAITSANVISIVKDFWQNIPDKFINDPRYIIQMNMTDYRLLKEANLALKESYTGVLDVVDLTAYLGTKIIGVVAMQKDHILGSIVSTNKAEANLFLGMEETETMEKPRIEKKSNGSKYYFVRIDVKADANYSHGPDLLLYEPV